MSCCLFSIMLLFIAGCASTYTRSGYDGPADDLSVQKCPLVITYKKKIPKSEGTILGKIRSGDSGFSTDCQEDKVFRQFRRDACHIGANVINVIEETPPNMWSTCYRATAVLIKGRDFSSFKTDEKYRATNIRARAKIGAENQKRATTMAVGAGVGGAVGGAIAGSASSEKKSGSKTDEDFYEEEED